MVLFFLLIRYVYSTDLKYEVYYNLPGGDFENTKMQKNEVWFTEAKDLNNTYGSVLFTVGVILMVSSIIKFNK